MSPWRREAACYSTAMLTAAPDPSVMSPFSPESILFTGKQTEVEIRLSALFSSFIWLILHDSRGYHIFVVVLFFLFGDKV